MKKPISPELPLSAHSLAHKKDGSVLLITLGFVLLITVITVAFLVRARSSLQTSQSYSKESLTQEIGEIGINTIAAGFQKEIKDATSGNLTLVIPDRTGMVEQNPRVSSLFRSTTDSHNISSSSTAKNGWRFDAKRWKAPALLTDAQYDAQAASSLPKWVYVFGNTSSGNGSASDVIGRYAAMAYDVGGLLDVNEAGSTLTSNSTDKQWGNKGSTAFAQLDDLFPPDAQAVDFSQLLTWRESGNLTLSGNGTSYYGPITYPDSVNPLKAGRIEVPDAKRQAGDNRFFSRMEFVEAAKAGKLGLNKDILPYFRTRSEVANRLGRDDVYDGATMISNGSFTVNPMVQLSSLTYTRAAPSTISITRLDGSTDTINLQNGDRLFSYRFPLSRLRWLADRKANGTPNHPNEIRKYFGLTWNAASKMFFYTSPDANAFNASNTAILTLSQLAAKINNGTIAPREPDFFEWLKASIDPASLGQTGGSTNRKFQSVGSGASKILATGEKVAWELSKDLHIARIGANIIDQSDPDSIPTGIRTRFSRVGPALGTSEFDSFGQENLPSLNEVIATAYRPNNGPKLYGYLQFELWNPNQTAYEAPARQPKGYTGNPITQMRVGTTSGAVYMEPLVYWDYFWTYSGGLKSNSAWGNDSGIADYSQMNLQASDFVSPNLTNQFITIPYNSTLFQEPFLATSGGQDATNGYFKPASGSISSAGTMFLGAPPAANTNALLVCTVNAPNPAFVNIPLAAAKNEEISETNPGIYPFGTKGNKVRNDGAPHTATTTPSGAKAFNAVKFLSDGQSISGVSTSPVTFQVGVRADGNWFPVNNYNNLAINQFSSTDDGLQKVILSNDDNTRGDKNEKLWGEFNGVQHDSNVTNVSGNTPACFVNWKEWSIRKGFFMTDPRTERFGLSDQNQATPGMGIMGSPTTANHFYSTGLAWNMPGGMAYKVGGSANAAGKLGSNLVPAPGWTLFITSAVKSSSPSDLARNIPPNYVKMPSSDENPNGVRGYDGHAYRDYVGLEGNSGIDGLRSAGDLAGDGTNEADYYGQTRPADACWVPANAHPALPVIAQSPNTNFPDARKSRPVILDRPFRSVAELGVVFRDVPWKSLDLFSPYSADRLVLDVFSIEDSATVSGKINPNTASEPVLKALLRGTLRDPSNPNWTDPTDGSATSQVPDTNADKVAAALANLNAGTSASDAVTSASNLAKHLSETPASAVVNQFVGPVTLGPADLDKKLPLTPLPTAGDASSSFSSYKIQTENFLRALSSTTDARNWQLMLDVVAQSGRLAPPGANFQDFLVEGQKRYFVYLTLDRITGEILNKYIEPVYE